jgi:hypothetical protein
MPLIVQLITTAFRFIGMTPCLSRALRFSVVKTTTEAQRSRRLTENTQSRANL